MLRIPKTFLRRNGHSRFTKLCIVQVPIGHRLCKDREEGNHREGGKSQRKTTVTKQLHCICSCPAFCRLVASRSFRTLSCRVCVELPVMIGLCLGPHLQCACVQYLLTSTSLETERSKMHYFTPLLVGLSTVAEGQALQGNPA